MGSVHQLFLVIQNLKSKTFQNFFLYQVLCTLNFLGRGRSGQKLFLFKPNLKSKIFQNFFLY